MGAGVFGSASDLVSLLIFFVGGAGSCYIAQTGFKLTVLLPEPPES
jgi:hypothetical protein